MQTNLNLSVIEMAFNFAKRIDNNDFADIRLSYITNELLLLGIILRDLHACNPLVGLYDDYIKHQKSERFSNVAEYLYYSFMYKSPIPVGIHDYLPDPTENGLILLDVRDLDAKHKSIASFVDRLNSIFALPKFCITLRLEMISRSITSTVINPGDAIHVTMRFNYLNHIVTKLYTEPNTTIKILMYLLLLR